MKYFEFRNIFICLLLLILVMFSAGRTAAAATGNTKLKDLHLSTSLLKNQTPTAVIVSPSNGKGQSEAIKLASQLQALTGVTFQVVSDTLQPEKLLEQANVIAIGNMATNRFIEHLYRQWQVILDLTYPGKDGYVVRSLHNPYGTGRNVIFIGGSDDSGVAAATEAFLKLLKKPKQGTLAVGRLMEIRLGRGVTLPLIGAFMPKWQVSSWNDSHRTVTGGRTTGYEPSTVFGWNPISVAGMLYYMTGQKEYLDCFKELALPKPPAAPPAISSRDAFTDPLNPLVKVNHYHAHLMTLVYDLIEESPLFSDQERLQITAKLLEQQNEYDAKDTYVVANGDRHALWHLMTIYTGSRYFSVSYPSPRWERRIANVRTSFRTFLNNPTWGTRDTLFWVSTSIEPLFEFFLMDGFEEFVGSGTAKTMLRGLEVLMTGDEVDNANKFLSLSLLHKAAYMTGDGRYIWMRDRFGYDLEQFRIGQSYWPSEKIAARAPDDLSGRITVAPLAPADLKASQTPVKQHEAFQILSYRTGLERNDDYLLLDGFEGKGRHPYELNTISRLRLFGGKNVLDGHANGVSVWRNGMVNGMAARGAALKQAVALPGISYIRTEVPDMPSSLWQRNILTIKGKAAIVIDQITAREPGDFDVIRSWQTAVPLRSKPVAAFRVLLTNGVVMSSPESGLTQEADRVLQSKISRPLQAGESIHFATLFSRDTVPLALRSVKSGYLLSGVDDGFLLLDKNTSDGIDFNGKLLYLGRNRLLALGVTNLKLQGKVVVSVDQPVSIAWDFSTGELSVTSDSVVELAVTTRTGLERKTVLTGHNRFAGMVPGVELQKQVAAILQLLDQLPEQSLSFAQAEKKKLINRWKPLWEIRLNGSITKVVPENSRIEDTENGFWAAAQGKNTTELARYGADGVKRAGVTRPGELLSLWVARSSAELKALNILAGFKDDQLYAFGADGSERWRVKTEVSQDFRIGTRYDAPWFTDPSVVSGVYSLWVGTFSDQHKPEIVIGRPSTVEFRSLDGTLAARVATRWGTNTALALFEKPGLLSLGKALLVGKGYAGNPTITAINTAHKKVSDGYYGGMLSGFSDMHAWLQRGVGQLLVSDLGNSGREQVVFTLSGHWNELRVYDGQQNKPLWMKSFGPDRAGGGFMRGLQALDLQGTGTKTVLAATRNGWLTAFGHDGTELWQRRFDAAVTAVVGDEHHKRVIVGCADGSLHLLDQNGKVLSQGSLGASVQTAAVVGNAVVAGGADGSLKMFPLSGHQSRTADNSP